MLKGINKAGFYKTILKVSTAFVAMLFTVILVYGIFGYINQKKFNRIQPGMTKTEVLKAVGDKEPNDKQYKGGKEIWYYDVISTAGLRAKMLVFVDGKLAEISESAERQAMLDKKAAEMQAQMDESKEEREKKLYGQICTTGSSGRKCPYPNQLCVVENTGDVQGICTITCGDDFDCGSLETGVSWLSCVDLYRGTRACWKK